MRFEPISALRLLADYCLLCERLAVLLTRSAGSSVSRFPNSPIAVHFPGGAGGRTRTGVSIFLKIHYSATTSLPPEVYSLITVERQ